MPLIYLVTAVFAIVFILVYHASVKPALLGPPEKPRTKIFLWCMLAAALVVRIIIAACVEGHDTDMNCFRAWAGMAYNGGLQNFYFTDAFTDYPPGYMYVLWLLGGIQSWFSLDYGSTLFMVLIKLPAILCDIAMGYLIYHILQERAGHALGVVLSALYVFNPAIVVNSAAWGQVDGVYTLFVALFIYALVQRKMLISCICFTVGFLIKPQMAVFTPVLLFGLYNMVIGWKGKTALSAEQRKKGLIELLISAGVCIALAFVLVVPFAQNFNFGPIIEEYVKTISSDAYPYASVNAFNFFALFGGNWAPIDETFLFLTYGTWTTIFILADVALAVWIFIRHKQKTNLFLVGALLITTMFVMAGKMHERYVFPALALLLLAFAYKKDTRCLWLFGALSATQFLNTAAMLYQNIELGTTAPPDGALMPVVALCNLAILGYMIYVAFTGDRAQAPAAAGKKNTNAKGSVVMGKKGKKRQTAASVPLRPGFSLQQSAPPLKLIKWDYIIMAAVLIIYTAVALFNLGDMAAPETVWKGQKSGDGFVVELSGNTYIEKMKFFPGVYENRKANVRYGTGSGSAIEWSEPEELEFGSVFCWHESSVKRSARYIEITATTDLTWINEIAFIDTEGQVITPASVEAIGGDRGVANLTDESELVPEKLSYRNSTYFDEIYHARTAYEFTNSLWAYENTHPPLGKVLISLGILVFGMNPFGWRIVGTLFGAAMLPCIYLFAKRMFRRTDVASIAMILFAADFMHFAQTRIATIDVYITFFIIPMYYFMYKYTTMSFYDTPLRKTLVPLGLSGLFMGLGVASKWTGVYAGIGLAVLFFISLGRRWYEYRKVMGDKRSAPELKQQVSVFKRNALYTLLACVGFFVVVPAAIYCASYIPWLQAPGAQGLQTILTNQQTMFNYHSNLNATHPFSSLWYQWPIIYKPIWYYSGPTVDGVRESIASFGNPFIWWVGLVALVGVAIVGLKKKDWRALVLIVGYLAQYLPWVGVTRIVFIYHYFTCVPFLILMLAYMANWLFERYPYSSGPKGKAVTWSVWGYVAACVILFAVFYPVLSGAPASTEYIDGLRWFDSWIF